MSEASAKRPTIIDVAQRAGVSKSLVSLVMQNSGNVSEGRRARVLQAADELGYKTNWVARSLSASPSSNNGLIAFVTRDLEQPWASDFIAVARPVLEAAGYTVIISLLSPPSPNQGLDFSILDVFRDLRVAGLVFVGSMHDHASFSKVVMSGAVVYAGWGPDDLSTADVVRSDDAAGMSLVVDHLVENGHRNIVHIGGIPGVVAQTRAGGYADTMRRHGLGDLARVIDADYTIKAGYAAAIRVLDVPVDQRPTALACADDLAAMGAMSAASELGLRIAVTGYDNIEMTALHQIGLTTVDLDNQSIGTLAANSLLRRIDDSDAGHVYHAVTPRLIVRRSSAPLP